MSKVIHVAVAILKKSNGDFLLASRPVGKHWAGWWEFPGGKIETGESPEQALIRELQEEIGVVPTQLQPWLQRRFDYPATHDSPAKTVHLHFFFVTQWQGELIPKEGQKLSWQTAGNVSVEPVLPANVPIMNALALPSTYAISNMAAMGETAFFEALTRQLKGGLQLIQVREKQLDHKALSQFALAVKTLAKPFGAKVLLNENIALAVEVGLDGVHLPSKALLQLENKPQNLLVAASCHHAAELAHARMLALDFVTLSPVAATASHLEATPMGWAEFSALASTVALPVFALGGMRADDLPQALASGAQGVAMQRAIWDVTAP
ncbi:MAG: DNA mismatch repair protein MutT [Methylophilaceae bacterium]|nr:MAG: DNA mismatch repair protein MutT [Methylophilaceae bacterium]